MTGLAAVWISIAFQAFGKRCKDYSSAPKAKAYHPAVDRTLLSCQKKKDMGGPPKIGGTPPKWMVNILENPIFLMDDFGGKTPFFLETPIKLSFTSSDSLKKKKPDLSTTFRITSRHFRGLGTFPRPIN